MLSEPQQHRAIANVSIRSLGELFEAALEEQLLIGQVNGKVRGKMMFSRHYPRANRSSAIADAKVMSFCDSKKIKRWSICRAVWLISCWRSEA
jgi:hypothetical protein